MKTKKKAKNGNGATAKKAATPKEVQLEEVHVLKIQLSQEKGRRIASDRSRVNTEAVRVETEARAHQVEHQALFAELNAHYDVNLDGYALDLERGVAVRPEQPQQRGQMVTPPAAPVVEEVEEDDEDEEAEA